MPHVAATGADGQGRFTAPALLNLKTPYPIRSPRAVKAEQLSANRHHTKVKLTSPAEVDEEVAVLVQAQSGNPVNIVTTNSALTGVANTVRPDAAGPIAIIGSVDRWFDTSALTPSTPREKGSVEGSVRYVKTGFWPARRFATLPELDVVYATWRDQVANRRRHATGAHPHNSALRMSARSCAK